APAGQPAALAGNANVTLVATTAGVFERRAPATEFVRIRMPVEQMDTHQVAVGPAGQMAVAAQQGLFLRDGAGRWKVEFPRDGERSWSPVDVRGAAYDSIGRLWFASLQGAGCLSPGGWRLYTGVDGLPYDDFTTIAAGEAGVIWFGTTRGAIRY